MEKIVWDDSFSVGQPELDSQHRRLAELINDLADQSTASKDPQYVQRLVSTLTSYALYHFGREEQLLSQCGFPHLQAQIDEHEEFCRITMRIGRDAACGVAHLDELARFLAQWWRHHILEEDMRYKPYVAALSDKAGGGYGKDALE